MAGDHQPHEEMGTQGEKDLPREWDGGVGVFRERKHGTGKPVRG